MDYYTRVRDGVFHIEKIPLGGGPVVTVRTDDGYGLAVADGGTALYYLTRRMSESGCDVEIRKAAPEDGPSEVLARIDGSRVPVLMVTFQPVLSPDGNWLALALADGATSNIWVMPTAGGPMRQITDFGEQPVMIARRVSWSPDGCHLYAAVAENAGDVVLMDGLLG